MAHRKAVRHMHETGHLHELTVSWCPKEPFTEAPDRTLAEPVAHLRSQWHTCGQPIRNKNASSARFFVMSSSTNRRIV